MYEPGWQAPLLHDQTQIGKFLKVHSLHYHDKLPLSTGVSNGGPPVKLVGQPLCEREKGGAASMPRADTMEQPRTTNLNIDGPKYNSVQRTWESSTKMQKCVVHNQKHVHFACCLYCVLYELCIVK
jgi:hypothetical protein